MKKSSEKNILCRFGNNVRRLRIAQAFSQEELAAGAGVHRTYVGMIERGEKNITLISMARVAAALNVKLEELLEGIDDGQ